MNPHSLTGSELKKWREEHRLSQDELGELLSTSREWVGKLERGEREISADIFLRFERLRRDPRFSPEGVEPMVEEQIAPFGPPSAGTPDALRREVRETFEAMLATAGDQLDRLGWLKVELGAKLALMRSWWEGPPRPPHDERHVKSSLAGAVSAAQKQAAKARTEKAPSSHSGE